MIELRGGVADDFLSRCSAGDDLASWKAEQVNVAKKNSSYASFSH